jgi:hypothetical protein
MNRIVEKQKILHLLDYRMQSVEQLNWALSTRSQWDAAPPIAVHIDGKLSLEGNLNAITNPMLEVGLVHCRALLEFLGLRSENGKLSQIQTRRPTDIGIEYFESTSGPLTKVSPETAVSRYKGDEAEAERALLRVFQLTNKHLAHCTFDLNDEADDIGLIDIASRGVTALMISYFYTPLGLTRPESPVRR